MQTDSELEILQLIPIGYIRTDFNCNILKINLKAKNLLGIVKDVPIKGQRLTDFVDHTSILNNLWAFVKHGWQDMDFNNLEINNKILNIQGRVSGLSYVINITDNTLTSKALDKATQSLLIGQENEKRRIAREIHDGIGQAISTVRMHLDFTMTKVESQEIKSDMTRINQLITEIATDLRNLSHDLMPSSLVDFGLITAITTLIRRINQTQSIYVHFENDLNDKDIPYNYALNIYRIIQELVNNSIKHASCKEVKIYLTIRNNKIKLIVSDDGKGQSNVKQNKGIGLYNIKNRLASINGQIKIETAKQKGFKAIINIPFVNSKAFSQV